MIDLIIKKSIKAFIYSLFGGLTLWFVLGHMSIVPDGKLPVVDDTKWQAVFLQNNQVYFGKMKEVNDGYLTLSDVYYLKSAGDLQDNGSLNLIKLGGEVHGPEDVIFVPKSSVLLWENMKDSSRVVQSILNSKH